MNVWRPVFQVVPNLLHLFYQPISHQYDRHGSNRWQGSLRLLGIWVRGKKVPFFNVLGLAERVIHHQFEVCVSATS
jgi:hypothetical protein